jgi:flagellar hook-associated protein 2
MGIQISGAISGLNTTEIIEQLMSVERQSRTRYADQLNLYEWREDALRGVKTDLLGLKSQTTDLQDQFDFPPMSGISTNSAKVSAATTSSSLPGTYLFQNVTLGTVETWISTTALSAGSLDPNAKLADLALDNPFASGSFDINGVTINVDITADTLNTLMTKINSSAADVTAFYDPTSNKVGLARTTIGDSDITITDSGTNIQNAFKLPGASSGGTDTAFTLNGMNMTTTGTTFEVNGTTFNLLQNTGAGETVSLTVAQDLDEMTDQIQAWIDKYNEITSTIRTYLTEEKVRDASTDADKKKGLLRNDSTLRMIYTDLYSLTSNDVDGLASTMNTLSEIGIYRGDDGTLSIGDETALRNALAGDLTTVSSLFGGNDDIATPEDERGIAVRLEDLLEVYTTTTSGLMDIKIGTESDGADQVQSLLDRFDTRLAKVEQRYIDQFAEMEQALAALQQQSSWISGQISSMNSNWGFNSSSS